MIVTARFPASFFSQAAALNITFTQVDGKPWLWEGQVGFQAVTIVVCKDLPLELPYSNWLFFMPYTKNRFLEFFQFLIDTKQLNLLEKYREMRPKEFDMTFNEVIEKARKKGYLTPDEEAYIAQIKQEALAVDLKMLAKKPQELSKLLSVLNPKERLADLTPEERFAGLTPEERLSGLTAEERKELLKTLMEQSQAEQ